MTDEFIYLKGSRVELKRLSPTRENALMWSVLTQKNVYRLERFMEMWCGDVDPDWALRCLYINQSSMWHDRVDGFYFIFLKKQMIGLITAHTKKDKTELSYWLDKSKTGHGYATEAMSILENYLFKKQKLTLTLYIDPKNKPSLNLAKRLKYVKEGEYYVKSFERHQKLRSEPPKPIRIRVIKNNAKAIKRFMKSRTRS